jgi:hypothetical protein
MVRCNSTESEILSFGIDFRFRWLIGQVPNSGPFVNERKSKVGLGKHKIGG